MKKEIEYLKKYLKNKNLDEAIKELENGRPIQYIVGNVEFYNSIININENVLIPRFETELLVEKLIKYVKDKFNNEVDVLDLCTGSGCIAICLKKELICNIDAVDISNEALKVAIENARINEVDIKFIESDLFGEVKNKYNIIVSNPPYISCDEEIMDIVKNNEPNIALYASDNGLYFYKEIIKNINKYLKEDFIIAFEIGMNQASDIVRIINDYFDDVIIKVEKDYSNRDRFIFVFSKK